MNSEPPPQATLGSASPIQPLARVGALQGKTCNPAFLPETVKPYLQAFVLLDGEQRFTLDGMDFTFDTGAAGHRGPLAGVFCVAKPAPLVFTAETDDAMRKVRVAAPLEWIASLVTEESARVPLLRHFFSTHLSHHVFLPDFYLVDLAEQVLNPPVSLTGEFLSLYRQSRGLEIFSHICRALVEREGDECGRATSRILRQSMQARDYILAHAAKGPTLDQVARHAGATESGLQRGFREHYGITIREFIRRSRLDAAREALERNGVTIAQAAHIAGFAHHSNFTTAFKRFYGMPPRDRRR